MSEGIEALAKEPSSPPYTAPAAGHGGELGGYVRPTPGRYFAVDIRSSFVNRSERKRELASLYQTVFNEIDTVPDLWSDKSAMDMINARVRRTGCNVVLVDVKENDKIIGAFLANIVPGPLGWKLVEPDILLAKEYRGLNLGSELGWVGRTYADTICLDLHGETIAEDNSKTYLVPEFPKSMWQRKGYVLHTLFAQNARHLLGRDTALRNVHKYRMDEGKKEQELERLVNFIANEAEISSDGYKWQYDRANTFVRFMLTNNFATFDIAAMGDRIVAISAADVMPGRVGPELVGAQCFVRSTEGLAAIGAPKLKAESVAAFSFDSLITAADGVAKFRWGQGLSSIEVHEPSAPFFKSILPSLHADEVFQSMEGDHNTLRDNMEPPVDRRQITLIPVLGFQAHANAAFGD